MNCAYCRRVIEIKPRRGELKATRDHIIPQCDGGWLVMGWSLGLPTGQQTRNWKWCCVECNGLRAACYHCAGFMACVVAVANRTKKRKNLVVREWNRGRPYPRPVSQRHFM